MTKIAVIVGSTRSGRQTDKLARWVANDLKSKKINNAILDLSDFPMPFFHEAAPPRYNPERKPDAQTKKWLDAVSQYDGYVIVSPEYNRGMPAVLKNAIDVLGYEMEDKPVAIVSHGSSGGAQSAANLRMALPGVGAVTLPQALYFSDRLADVISDEGNIVSDALLQNHYGPQVQLDTQMDKLVAYVAALTSLRS